MYGILYEDSDKRNETIQKQLENFIMNLNSSKFQYVYTENLSDGVITNEVIKKANAQLISDLTSQTDVDSINFVITQCFDNGDNSLYYDVLIFVNDIYYTGISLNQELVKEKPSTPVNDKVVLTGEVKGITLEAEKGVLPENTVLETETLTNGEQFDKVSTIIKNAKSWSAYEITLKANGTKIQPNGKVKIRIPISRYDDTSSYEIYRIDEEGNKIKYDVTIEKEELLWYATFETDHFSTYVLAEYEKTQQVTTPSQNEGTTNKGEKDNTPKTGTIDVIGYISILAIISAIGIVAFRRKETK